ncbi:MAG: N-acyl homoserine lactonase family protein [Caulobacteraceae bacterium]|nr:N-acyl homoserine lactonase family protein [Caulobacteraceae bacterium]
MRMHLLSGGRLVSPRRFYFEDAPKGSTIELPVSCALIKHKQGNVLFDTGCHPDAVAHGEARWGALVKVATPIFRPEDTVAHQLPKAGLTPADIDVVVCSHLHMDHCGCNAFFPRAVVICHAKELAAASAPDAEDRGYVRAEWDYGATFETVEGERDLFGDRRLTLIPTPGHTAGSLIAHVVLDRDGAFVITSDTVAVRESLEARTVPRINFDADLTLKAYDEIERLQKDGAEVIFSHDDTQWRTLRTGEAFYE